MVSSNNNQTIQMVISGNMMYKKDMFEMDYQCNSTRMKTTLQEQTILSQSLGKLTDENCKMNLLVNDRNFDKFVLDMEDLRCTLMKIREGG